MSPEYMWRKPSRSQNGQNCVELRNTLEEIRDSKNPAGPTLRIDIAQLTRALKNGRFQ